MNFKNRCNHEWEEIDNKIVCKLCGSSTLKKIKIDDDLSYGIKDDGSKYVIRKDRNKYLYPNEWNKLVDYLRKDHKLIFDFLISTGARIEEALCFKKSNLIDDRRKIIRLTVTKRKANKPGEEEGKMRSFEIKASLYNSLKLSQFDYIFLHTNGTLERDILKNKARNKAVAVRGLFKRALKSIELDERLYNLHNIRKTHGMWLKALDIKMEEICLRLGHDANTYLKHYGSPSIFDGKDKERMIKILGRIYGL